MNIIEPVLWSAEFKPVLTLTELSFPTLNISNWPVVIPTRFIVSDSSNGHYIGNRGIVFVSSPNYLTSYSGGVLHIPEVCIRKNSSFQINQQVRWSRYTYKLHSGNRGIVVGCCIKVLDDGSIHLQIK